LKRIRMRRRIELANMEEELQNKIKDLEDRIRTLEGKRIFQQDLMPDVVKMRHIGEGVRFIRSGLATNKPTAEKPMQGSAVYWATDTGALYLWSGTAWVQLPRIPASPSAYTQTYSTALRTVANATAVNPPAGGTGATEGAYDTAAHRDEMITSLTAANADILALKKVVTAIIDDLQSIGLIA